MNRLFLTLLVIGITGITMSAQNSEPAPSGQSSDRYQIYIAYLSGGTPEVIKLDKATGDSWMLTQAGVLQWDHLGTGK